MAMLLGVIGAVLFLCGMLVAYYAGRRDERTKQERLAEVRRYRWRPSSGALAVADDDARLNDRIAQLRRGATR
jgi:hypothetical protein